MQILKYVLGSLLIVITVFIAVRLKSLFFGNPLKQSIGNENGGNPPQGEETKEPSGTDTHSPENELDENTDFEGQVRFLYKAVSEGNYRQVIALIPEKVPGDIHADDGLTPLHIAAQEGHFDILKYLVEQGADVNKIHKATGSTPLHYAAMNKPGKGRPGSYQIKKDQLKLVEFLLKTNADPTIVNHQKRTALDCAMISSYKAVEEMILKYGGTNQMFDGPSVNLEEFLKENRK